jgi:hypothetical protein
MFHFKFIQDVTGGTDQTDTRMRSQLCYVSDPHSCVTYSAWNTKDNYDMSGSVFVVKINGFMSLTS